MLNGMRLRLTILAWLQSHAREPSHIASCYRKSPIIESLTSSKPVERSQNSNPGDMKKLNHDS